VFLVVNPDPARGQFSSLQTGLQEVLNRGRDKALITHVDRVPVAAATIEALKVRSAEVASSGKWLVVPEYAQRHGHPVVARREMIERWLKSPADSIAREIEHSVQQHVEYLSVDDANVLANVNTPEEYQKLVDSE
jgi:molybdenum cofactor cytidylyltransferase